MDVSDADVEDPHPDIGELFRHYNLLYFRGALASCAVHWSSPRMTSCTGACRCTRSGCVITLSEPLLKFRSTDDLKNTLLHEMIHAILFVKEKKHDHSAHGPSFRAWMDAINSNTLTDNQRPSRGYNITIYHDFREEMGSYMLNHWKCESCGDLIKRAFSRGPPANACIELVDDDKTCGNLLCHWHNHKVSCGGSYVKIPDALKGKKGVSKGAKKHRSCVSKMSKSGTTWDDQESHDSAVLHDKSILKKPNAVTKHLSLVDGINGNSLGSSSTKAVGFQKPEVTKLITTKRHTARGKQKQVNSLTLQLDCSYKSRKRPAARKHEIAVASAWLDYYASEESDEPVEPLINKRTQRRKREKMLKYSRVRKRRILDASSSSAHSSDPGSHSLVCCENSEIRTPQNKSTEQPSPVRCLDIIVADPAYQPTPLQVAGPPNVCPSNSPSQAIVIYISDDD